MHGSGVLFPPRGAPGLSAPGWRPLVGPGARACVFCAHCFACVCGSSAPVIQLYRHFVLAQPEGRARCCHGAHASPRRRRGRRRCCLEFLDHSSFHVCFDVAHASVRAKRTRTPSRLVRAANAQLPGALQRHTYPSRVHLSPTTSARTRKHRQHRLDVAFYRA
jgi:hypothetical protein